MEPFTRHGGGLAHAEQRWPAAPRPWLDLSTGINPQPYPARRASRPSRGRLPLDRELRALEAAAAGSFSAPSPERVAAVAGAEAAIRLLPHLLETDRVAIAGPTYGGHAEAWAAAGRTVQVAPWDVAREAAPVLVLVNPNNPNGRRVSPPELLHAADRTADRGGWLIVDESFGEVAPELSVAGCGHPRIIVLRSFGKFYGLAGLRLGFVVASPAVIHGFRALLGDWPVSADAIAAGLQAYADATWAERTRRRLARDAERLRFLLVRAGFAREGGTDLFQLVSHPDAGMRFQRLGEAGVLVRPFADAPERLRFGLPPAHAWSRLQRTLGEMA